MNKIFRQQSGITNRCRSSRNIYRSTPHCRITLGISSVVMCNAAVEDEIQIWRDEYYVSITVIFPYLLVLLIECQRVDTETRLNKRVWIGHCFHGTVKRFFFLMLDNIAFDHFPLSLVTLTLLLAAITNKLLGDNCQFLFRQQSSLVRFIILCFFFYFWFSLFSQKFSK